MQVLNTVVYVFPCTLIGYTKINVTMDEGTSIFRAHPSYCGKPWYDWTYIDQEKMNIDYTHQRFLGLWKFHITRFYILLFNVL